MNAVPTSTQTSAKATIAQNSGRDRVRVEREQPERRQADDERRDELEGDVEEEVALPKPPVGALEEERH